MAGLPIGLRVNRHSPESLGFTRRKNYTALREILSVCIKSDCDYLRYTDTSGFLPPPPTSLRQQADGEGCPATQLGMFSNAVLRRGQGGKVGIEGLPKEWKREPGEKSDGSGEQFPGTSKGV